MEKETITGVKNSIKHWYLPLILGIIFIAVGIWVFRTPLESYIALAVLFSVAFLVTGVVEITFAITNREKLNHWGWSLTVGIIDFLIGILLVSRPGISMVVLPFYVGFVVLFRSMFAIGWAIELKRQAATDWGYIFLLGIFGIIFSFILLWNPFFAGMTIVFYTAWALIIIGGFNIYLAFKLRKLSKLE